MKLDLTNSFSENKPSCLLAFLLFGILVGQTIVAGHIHEIVDPLDVSHIECGLCVSADRVDDVIMSNVIDQFGRLLTSNTDVLPQLQLVGDRPARYCSPRAPPSPV